MPAIRNKYARSPKVMTWMPLLTKLTQVATDGISPISFRIAGMARSNERIKKGHQ